MIKRFINLSAEEIFMKTGEKVIIFVVSLAVLYFVVSLFADFIVLPSGTTLGAVMGGVTPNTGAQQTTVCADSDGGTNYAVKGTCVDSANNVAFMDRCEGKYVVEYYCNVDSTCSYTKYPCQYGCYDGSCNESELV